jgi:toxin ParE1/3/4
VYEVLLTAGAEHDLDEIVTHVAATGGEAVAEHVLDRLLEVSGRLSRLPERGTRPKELLALGIREYRQVFFKPYRVVYRIAEQKVFIVLIAVGRRDMQSLLARRLLSAP